MAKDEPSSETIPADSPASGSLNSTPWDGFVNGPENALAQASVQALARGGNVAVGLSPLIVHGSSGVGKSRLLTALVAECLLRRPGSAVAHLEAEAFAAACAEAAGQRGGWAELRGRFRRLDMFVLEDLHALERAPLALSELIHTLDALDEAGAAVAISARLGPGQWTGGNWPPRLVNRLIGGLAVRVDPPGLASRRRFVLERARERGLALTAEAVEALAGAGDGYRTLDGWLVRLGLTGRVGRHQRPLEGEPHHGAAGGGRNGNPFRQGYHRPGRPCGRRPLSRPPGRAPRRHPAADDRHPTAPGDPPGPHRDRPELPGDRHLFRRSRPCHGAARLPRGRRAARRRSGPRGDFIPAPPSLATCRNGFRATASLSAETSNWSPHPADRAPRSSCRHFGAILVLDSSKIGQITGLHRTTRHAAENSTMRVSGPIAPRRQRRARRPGRAPGGAFARDQRNCHVRLARRTIGSASPQALPACDEVPVGGG